MDVAKLLATLTKGVEFAEELLPVINMIPVAGPLVATAINAAGAVTEIVENIQTRAAEGKIVLASNDQDEIKALTTRLEAVNDELAAYIDQT